MTALLDRDAEIDRLRALLDAARDGDGRVAVVEGPPGIGKSSLLERICDIAEGDGFLTHRAWCGEFERDHAFGVARQLFGSRVDFDVPVTDFQVFESLQWACTEITADVPLLLSIDDAHWADVGTLAWLRFLGRRLADLRVVVLLTVRSDEIASADSALRDIVAAAQHEAMLSPLSATATTAILAETLQAEPEERFAHAFHRATGGNPFLATELAREMDAAGVKPVDPEAWTIGSLRPQAIVRNIDARLRRLPSDAQALAQAAAIFGMHAEFRHAAALAGLGRDDAVDAADALHRAWIVRDVDPLSFEHSVTRDAILAELSPARLARDHKRAADALAAEGAPVDRVASHLLLSTPVGDPGTVRWLGLAADSALRRGAPSAAVTYAERALLEPPPRNERWQSLWQLGRAEILLGTATARLHVQEALDECADPSMRSRLMGDLVHATMNIGSLVEAYELLEAEIDAATDLGDEVLDLEVRLQLGAQLDHELIARARPRLARVESLSGDTPARRAVLGVAAFVRSNDGTRQEEVLRLLHAAYADGAILDDPHDDPMVLGFTSRAAINFGEVEIARAMLGSAAERVRIGGSLNANAGIAMSRSALELTVGDVDAAADAIQQCVSILEGTGLVGPIAASAALRVAIAIERGDLDGPHELLESMGLLGPIPPFGVLDQLLHHRGALRGARGELDDAIADLLELGRREAVAGTSFTVTQWRATVGPLLAHAGRGDEGRALLDEELAIARHRGAAKPLGVALRARAAVLDGDERLSALEESVAVLDPSPFRLELARSLVDLGATLRRANRRAEARPHLDRALEIAHRNGATALETRARVELDATGARPRRPVVTGPDALTASERRVAELAAAGRSNPEIARELFVSRKTVETHLGRVYQKLGISDRRRIGESLGRAVTPPA
jgi:DNA-binding CsgD family transcriptional regulator